MGSNGRNTTSVGSSRAGTQTPKAAPQTAMPTMTGRAQQQRPNPAPEVNKMYPQFNIPPPAHDRTVSENRSNSIIHEPGQGSFKERIEKIPGPRGSPVSVTKHVPNNHSLEPHQSRTEPVRDQQSVEVEIELDKQSSSSSANDAAQPPSSAGRNAEEEAEEAVEDAIEDGVEDAESLIVDERDHDTVKTDLPDDHPIEWLAEAKKIYHSSVPPFATKQKLGVRRMVELPLVEGQKYAGKTEVVYRSWNSSYTFASIDKDGQRFIVKVFRGGSTPYRPWLGPEEGFSEKALAYSKQGPRILQGKRPSLPKGWALKEDDERDDDYSPANRRKSFPMRRRQRLNYDLNEEEEDADEDPFQEGAGQVEVRVHSGRSSIEGDYAGSDPGKQPLTSDKSTAQPPSQLINAVKKSLRLPKEQDVSPQSKPTKRRSIGGRAVTNESEENKRQKHKAVFSSDSEHSVPNKRLKTIKAVSHRQFPDPGPVVPQIPNHEPRPLDMQTLSPYKQSHTTLRIALIPYPLQAAVQRLRSCMTIATLFTTVIGVSGYKGNREKIFGISATFDCKPEDDADKSMVIREEWADSFDLFLEAVDGAESWKGEGGKCGVSVKLLVAER